MTKQTSYVIIEAWAIQRELSSTYDDTNNGKKSLSVQELISSKTFMTSLTRTVTFHHWDVLFLIHHLLQDVIVVALDVIFELANFYHRGRFGKIPLGFKFVPRLRPAGVDQGCEMGDFFLHRLETLVDRIISLK